MRIQQKRGNALKIKYVSCFGIVALSLLLAGCGNNKTEESTQVGMQAIAEHEYDDALQAFQIAEEKKENPQMIARGRGIASVGFTVAKSSSNTLHKLLPICILPKCPTAYACEVEPISPRLISPITTSPFSLQ